MEDFDNVKLMSKRPNIATLSGLRFDYLDPQVGMIDITDIAAGTAKCCRFAGQCYGWYSVARHQVRVSVRVEKVARGRGYHPALVLDLAMKALFHDSAEAYMNDCPSPFKRLLKSIWTPIEHAIERVIFTALDLPVRASDDPMGEASDPIERIIHEADEFMYLCEWHDIMNTERIKDWYYPGERPSFAEEPRTQNNRSWQDDYDYFMERYHELVSRRKAEGPRRAV